VTDVELDITKIVGGGRGMAHCQDQVWMVSGALPGERIRAELRVRRKGIMEATTLEVLTAPHPARELSPCPHSGNCGGCDWPHIRPDAGAAIKADVAAEAARSQPELSRLLRGAPVTPSLPEYRLRARLHWDPENGILGFFGHHTNTVEAISECRIVSPRLLRTLPDMSSALKDSCPNPADVEWLEDIDGKQAVAGLRRTRHGRPLLPEHAPGADVFTDGPNGFHILEDSGGLTRVWGRDHVRMDLPVTLEVPLGAFFQCNRHLAAQLFGRITELVGPEPTPTWDLHAGVGFLAAAAWHAAPRPLVMAEVSRASGRAAQRNLPDASVHFGTSAEELIRKSGRLPTSALVITDPPRAGMSTDLRRRLAGWHPDRILMMACDPATWARDTADLLSKGYTLVHLELIDLFPSTHHVEVLSVLESNG